MDLVQYMERLDRLAETVKTTGPERIVIPAANMLLASIRNRITNEGKNSAGAAIGTYSTKPGYFTRDQFVKKGSFKPGQKAHVEESQRIIFNKKTQTYKGGKVTKKVVKQQMKSMYLREGYKELRDIQGRRTDVMNYDYSGDTMAAYQLQATPDGALIGLVNERAAKIREGLEKKRGKAFYATDEELAAYNKEVTEESEKLTTKLLTGA